jgi:hypothetical protein
MEELAVSAGTKVGIVGIGVYLPQRKMTAAEISKATGGNWSEEAVREKLGIKEKYVPSNQLVTGPRRWGLSLHWIVWQTPAPTRWKLTRLFALERSGRNIR